MPRERGGLGAVGLPQPPNQIEGHLNEKDSGPLLCPFGTHRGGNDPSGRWAEPTYCLEPSRRSNPFCHFTTLS
jgi:hypothetical protein